MPDTERVACIHKQLEQHKKSVIFCGKIYVIGCTALEDSSNSVF